MRSLALLGVWFGMAALVVGTEAAAADAPLAPSPNRPSLVFNADWTQSIQGGPLVPGGSFVLDYDPARLPQCRVDADGFPYWQIAAWVRFWPSSVTTSYALFAHEGDPATDGYNYYASWVEQHPEVSIPAGTTQVETWFENFDLGDGYPQCGTWDSDYGRNFHFDVVAPAATVHFRGDWSVAIDGAPRAGAQLAIDYDLARLPLCRAQAGGADAWSIVALYRVDGGPIASKSVTTTGPTHQPTLAALSIPASARSVQMWFENTDTSGCTAWDSDYGRNFFFSIP